jgi:hypothetical protein
MTGRIERIELWHVNVPLAEPFWPSWIPGYPQTHIAQTFARFVTSDGLVGETAGPAFTRRAASVTCSAASPAMAADGMDGFRKRLRRPHLGWRNWWLEPQWFLAGKMASKPVYKHCRSASERLPRTRLRLDSSLRPLEERCRLEGIRR